jgi:hypothetical protein
MGQALAPAREPRRANAFIGQEVAPLIIIPGQGTGKESHIDPGNHVGLWLARQQVWRTAFAQKIVPRVRKYWRLYRNFDDTPNAGPRQQWRDRTVIPTPFKWIEARLPRIILGTWGGPERFVVEGRGFKDQEYEALVQFIMEYFIDKIRSGDARSESFMHKLIEGERYCQIMGHVWWQTTWRRDWDWVRTQLKNPDTGKVELIEMLEKLYDGLDFNWLPISDVACDVGGSNRWKIQRYMTTYEALQRENKTYADANPGSDPLYKNLEFLSLNLNQMGGLVERGDFSEPRDTEHWPLADGFIRVDPSEHAIEMWLCWDNVHRTLTKIANRHVELAHGLAPTPKGYDPLRPGKAIAIPGQVYGDSYLNWGGPLAQYQTRLTRARADEILLNIFGQLYYREGAIRSQNMFWMPGGSLAISNNVAPDRPISDLMMMAPRKPVFQEAFAEEAAREKQGEEVVGANAVTQGAEATDKSRDVTAAEINQRAIQGASRFQLEVLFKSESEKKPILEDMFDWIRASADPDELKKLLDDSDFDLPLDTTNFGGLDRPVDFIVNDPMFAAGLREKLAEIQQVVMPLLMPNSPSLPYMKMDKIIIELLRSTQTLRRRVRTLTRTLEEASNAGLVGPNGQPLQPPAAGGTGTPEPGTIPQQTTGAAAGASTGGGPGSGAFTGTGGSGTAPAGTSPEQLVAEV